eukprot:gb/GEZN01005631.1/.p1 GENE.gb/GEZN01005631.1/~~gb/GEZN01005631.1/.p1  ORF type:complete len:520 (-),score=89.83 gb/GEZN01005631.1/:218-1558(-)
MATLLLQLQASDPSSKWLLVLPRFHNTVHWGYGTSYPWSDFFDLTAMQAVMPVLEVSEFLSVLSHLNQISHLNQRGPADETVDDRNPRQQHNSNNKQPYKEKEKKKEEEETGGTEQLYLIDYILHLSPLREYTQHGEWQSLVAGAKPRVCPDEALQLYPNGPGGWLSGEFWGTGLQAKEIACFDHMGSPYLLIPHILSRPGRTFFIDQAKQTSHHCYDQHYSTEWWQIRRSMAYASHLRTAAEAFWIDMGLSSRPYLAVHLRRGDFVVHSKAPALEEAVESIRAARDAFTSRLQSVSAGVVLPVFVATATSTQELARLRSLLPGMLLLADWPHHTNFSVGQRLVLDMIISAHADWFLGTEDSTVTFRIREDRELLGRTESSTYGVVCGSTALTKHRDDGGEGCPPGTTRSASQAKDCEYPSFQFQYDSPPGTATTTTLDSFSRDEL